MPTNQGRQNFKKNQKKQICYDRQISTAVDFQPNPRKYRILSLLGR